MQCADTAWGDSEAVGGAPQRLGLSPQGDSEAEASWAEEAVSKVPGRKRLALQGASILWWESQPRSPPGASYESGTSISPASALSMRLLLWAPCT